jgi:hypothetical protein
MVYSWDVEISDGSPPWNRLNRLSEIGLTAKRSTASLIPETVTSPAGSPFIILKPNSPLVNQEPLREIYL